MKKTTPHFLSTRIIPRAHVCCFFPSRNQLSWIKTRESTPFFLVKHLFLNLKNRVFFRWIESIKLVLKLHMLNSLNYGSSLNMFLFFHCLTWLVFLGVTDPLPNNGYWSLYGSPISCGKAEDFWSSTGGPGISSWHCFARPFVPWRRRFLGGGGRDRIWRISPYLSGDFP